MDSWIIGHSKPDHLLRYLLDKAAQVEGLVVCFDYFDTLVIRNIEPEFTKQLASRLLSTVVSNISPPEELYRLRQELEKALCEESSAAGGELEFYLPSFGPRYLEILRKEKPGVLAHFSEERFTQLLLDLELSVETSVQRPCVPVVDLLTSLKEAGLRTILISDFYLPSSHFTPMLEKQGLDGLFERVFVSADYGLAKGSGRLYLQVCDELDCRPEQMVMIGDNPHSDIEMAGQQGLATIFIENPEQKAYYEQWEPSKREDHTRINQHFSGALKPGRACFAEMAHSLWYFVHLLFQALLKQQVEHVFFFSKEGEFLKERFDCFQEEIFGTRIITSHYLLVSRKATYLASLRPLDQETFTGIFTHYRDISLRDFLLSLNLEESLAKSVCQELDLDFDRRYPDLQNCAEFQKLKESELFQSIYETRRTQQADNLISYLDSFDIDFRQKGLTIVDVGWKGSIQDNLYHLLEKKVCFQGFYIGSLIAPNKNSNNGKKGILFDDAPAPTSFFDVYNNNRSLYEMMLGATHGSADGYFTRAQFENLPGDHDRLIRESIAQDDGELCVTTLDLPEERQLYESAIRPLQRGMAAVFSLQNEAYIASGCCLPTRKWFARQHARMVFKPKSEEVEFFERLYHLENFGIFEYTDFQADGTFTIRQRLRNLRNVVRDGAILESGIWPPIILRRLGIGFYRYFDGYSRHVRAFRR
jgi:HAD superfamily hydrolase (TIGR01549 family)